jgi:hypothetical protein
VPKLIDLMIDETGESDPQDSSASAAPGERYETFSHRVATGRAGMDRAPVLT